MSPSDFIHPEDAAALKHLESIPGFSTIMRKILELGIEPMKYGVNMASSIRLSEQQLPKLYRHLPPICKKLGIPEPDFYLQMDPNPNAWTFGDSHIFITVTSGLVEMMDDNELDAVIAHECGHILCHHVLYHSIANVILNFSESLGLLGDLIVPFKFAFWYWQRKSELSCDRAACVVTSPETVASVMARFSGGPKSLTDEINMEVWAQQAEEYDKIYNGGTWNKTLQIAATAGLDHPFSAVRVREILKWSKTEQYSILKNYVENPKNCDSAYCKKCGKSVPGGSRFCPYCGTSVE